MNRQDGKRRQYLGVDLRRAKGQLNKPPCPSVGEWDCNGRVDSNVSMMSGCFGHWCHGRSHLVPGSARRDWAQVKRLVGWAGTRYKVQVSGLLWPGLHVITPAVPGPRFSHLSWQRVFSRHQQTASTMCATTFHIPVSPQHCATCASYRIRQTRRYSVLFPTSIDKVRSHALAGRESQTRSST
jgi:hypothetical protein